MRTRQRDEKRTYATDVVIVVPTFNEQDSIEQVINDLERQFILSPYTWVVYVINDGTDHTAEIVARLQADGRQWLGIINRDKSCENPGLSGAMLLGLKTAVREPDSQLVVFMDGDGQHPASAVRQMVDKAMNEEWDIIVSTRYMGDASAEGLGSPLRRLYSKFFGWLPRVLFASRLWGVTDPLTGFLLVRTDVVMRPARLKAIGWKFGLELLLMSDAEHITQLQYRFEDRIGGQSKANAKVAFQYLWQLASLFWRYYFGRK